MKGPNAAALYGSRAGNGVILVTTKKGSKKDGFGIRYTGNFTWSSVAETLEQQERYGQGQIGANGGASYTKETSGSWGPVLDGSPFEAWNGETYAYSKYGNKLKDYLILVSHRITMCLSATVLKHHISVLRSVHRITRVCSRMKN